MPRWLFAGTDVADRYPCMCRPGGRCDPAWCPCAGRDDADAMPPACCSHRYTPAMVIAAKRQYDAGKAAKRATGRDG